MPSGFPVTIRRRLSAEPPFCPAKGDQGAAVDHGCCLCAVSLRSSLRPALPLWALSGPGGYEIPPAPWDFWLWCLAGGLSQILFTVVILWLFSFRSFAVGTTFSKLEVVLIAALGAVLLGDTVGPWAILAIAIGAVRYGPAGDDRDQADPGRADPRTWRKGHADRTSLRSPSGCVGCLRPRCCACVGRARLSGCCRLHAWSSYWSCRQ